MEFKPGDFVSTPNGNGYVAEVLDDQLIVDLVDGDHHREMFNTDQVSLLPE